MALYFHFTTTLPCYMCDDSVPFSSKHGTGGYKSDGVTKVYLFFFYIYLWYKRHVFKKIYSFTMTSLMRAKYFPFGPT